MEHTQQNHIELTREKFINVLHNALCNGLWYFNDYGLRFDYNDEHYNIAKSQLKEGFFEGILSMEDVWLKMLEMKFPINIIDIECEGEYNAVLDLDEMHSNLMFVPQFAIHNILEEQDDAVDCDAFLQAVIYKDVIFG